MADGEAAGIDHRVPRNGRRLQDRVLVAFHMACDVGDHATAWMLLAIIESIAIRGGEMAPGDRRKNVEPLVAAHERLWELKRLKAGRDPA